MNSCRALLTLALLSTLFTTGCTYVGAVRSNITPITTTGRTFKGNVSMMIDRDVTTAETTTTLGAHTVKVNAGSALNSALVEAARVVFPNVAPQTSAPASGSYEVLIKARLQHIAANATIEPGFWTARANITAQASVVIEILRADGSIAHRQVVTGTGLENRPVGTPEKVREGVEMALERAVQQISDGAATVFITGLTDATREPTRAGVLGAGI